MLTALQAVWVQDQGQDLVEYSLLIAFVTFATASLFLMGASGSLGSIWTTSNSHLTTAYSAAR